ncbi:hypothetical protein RYX36_004055 [Vicia faba]
MSIVKIENKGAKLGTMSPMDQVFWRTDLLEASLLGCSKRVKSKGIYKAYMPGRSGSNDVGLKSLLYYYDETCQPYIWIHDVGGGSLRMVKQQYVSLEDLRECCEIRILRDQHKGCISVCKRTRPDLC